MNLNDYLIDVEALYKAYHFDSEVGEDLLQSWLRLRKYNEEEIQLLIEVIEYKLIECEESFTEPLKKKLRSQMSTQIC